jgi:hypothetical protein
MKKLFIALILFGIIGLSGCTLTDPYPEDAYFGDIYSHGVLVVAGGGGDMFKATYDPANIVQQLVGLTAAQSLTNKQLTMNNADPIKWKTAGGIPQDTINLLGSNILQITNPIGAVQILGGGINLNFNIDDDIYLWGGTKGTGRVLVLYSGYASALDTLRDSPTLEIATSYWDGGAAVGWSGTIIHDMITAGATPKSQLKFSINGANILRLENNNGTIKMFSDGVLDMTTHQINNVVDPTLAQDVATKFYVDSGINYGEMYRHESIADTVIQDVDDWHLVNGFTTGLLGGGWTFHIGEQLAITAYANNGDGKTKVTVGGHTLINSDIISISGTTSYDGIWTVEQVAVNTFVIPTVWVADDGASTGEHGSHFHSATATSTGKYLVAYSLSIKPSSANCNVEVSVYYGTAQQTKSESVTHLGAITDYQVVAGYCIVDVTVNGVISLGMRNTTDGGDFLIRDGNMTLVKWH